MAKQKIESSVIETGFMRLPQVLRVVPLSASTIRRRCAAGIFPKPVKLGAKASAWRIEEVRAWIAAQGQSKSGAIAPGAKAPRAKRQSQS